MWPEHTASVALTVAALLSLASTSVSQQPPLPVPPNMLGPNNGGHFRFGTVSWVKLQQQPPKIRFTVEAAFRRSFGATNFQGSGADGKLVVGDKFKPSGLETIMFDFGDGNMLTPMMFTVQAYSLVEDWVQGVSTFEHTYQRLSSINPFQYVATFRGCCRLSELKANADTSWSLSSIMNVRDDASSPRLTVLPVQTIIKKQRPSSPNPFLYIPASDDTPHDSLSLALADASQPDPKLHTWERLDNIGAAPSIIATATAPKNLEHMSIEATTGRIILATGSIFSSDSNSSLAKCPSSGSPHIWQCQADFSPATGRSMRNLTNLQAGLYNIVVQLTQGNSSSPVEVMLQVVEEDIVSATPLRIPRLQSLTAPNLFYPSFSYALHVGYLGFAITPFKISVATDLQAMQIGFTSGRLPEGLRLSTVAGGSSLVGFSCVNGSRFCAEAPQTRCNGSSTATCTCMEADTGKACSGPHNSATACRGQGICQSCWFLGTCPTSMANLTVEWVPKSGQAGTHMLCFDAVAVRARDYCANVDEPGCRPLISPSQCVGVEILKDPPPRIWSTFADDVDPYAGTKVAYIGRTLSFTVYAADDNCRDTPAITMAAMPPGATLAPQAQLAGEREVEVLSYLNVTDKSSVPCYTQSRVFRWNIPRTFGGYKGRHCFYATDQCGESEMCSGELDTVEHCLDFEVASCQFAVSREQSIAEVAAIFGTDWIQVFNLNQLTSPDYMLFKNQVLNVGHKYVVGVGDTVLKIARRFGTTETSLKFLNYHLGELKSSNISVGQELCIIANSCFGEVQSIWDKNPHVDESLERWYAGVKSAYDALRKAKTEELAAQQEKKISSSNTVARRLLSVTRGAPATPATPAAARVDTWGKVESLMREMKELVDEVAGGQTRFE